MADFDIDVEIKVKEQEKINDFCNLFNHSNFIET